MREKKTKQKKDCSKKENRYNKTGKKNRAIKN